MGGDGLSPLSDMGLPLVVLCIAWPPASARRCSVAARC